MTAIAGLIYAGGKSNRFGADKAEALLNGQRLIDHVAKRLEPQVAALSVAGPVGLPNAPQLEDGAHSGKGPLAGLCAGLNWASSLPNIRWLLTAPCDVPDLPKNLVSLLEGNQTDTPKVLEIEGRWQTACALWPTTALPTIEETLSEGQDLSLHRALKNLQSETITVDVGALEGSFTNINTQADLEDIVELLRDSDTS